MLLAGRVVIVSGVGPGLGSDLVRACVEHGAQVSLVARSQERIQSVAHALGGDTLCIAADTSDIGAAERVVAETLERFGRIDGLVNNAAVIPPFTNLVEAPAADIASSLEANFSTALHLSRAVCPAMVEHGRGSIVMVSSAVVRHPKPRFGAYNIAKHAMVGLARSLALELGPSGIRVNTLVPGKIAGERLEDYFDTRARELGVPVEQIRDEYAANLALRRIPSSQEYADVAVFLLSDLSRAVTGHMLDVNGGEYFD
jgi:NAD(P)-dependent dehydrogenase (short-subunit alcohol dehydrogenase family)